MDLFSNLKKSLQKPWPTSFTVEIISNWRREGEKNISASGATIENAVDKAIKDFKIINNRDNVDGRYFITAHLANGKIVELPKKYWDNIVEKQEKK